MRKEARAASLFLDSPHAHPKELSLGGDYDDGMKTKVWLVRT